jgi:hypothetical protein
LHKKEVREEIAHWITLEMGKTSVDAMGDVWRGLEVVEAASRVGSEMLVSVLVFCEDVVICVDLYADIHSFDAKSLFAIWTLCYKANILMVSFILYLGRLIAEFV